MTKHQARLMFRTAAVFNWCAALVLWPVTGLPQLLGLVPVAGHSVYDQAALLCIAGFGYGYWLASNNPAQHHGIIRIGALLKVGLVLIVYGHFLLGSANLNVAILVSVDLVYAVLFQRYLKSATA